MRSLLDQDLPGGVWWHSLWIVASGCTDRTVEIAERLAREEPRLRLLVEPARLGKAHALGKVFEHARGNALILRNGDARAEPGSVAALLRAATAHPAPYAVMARPVLASEGGGKWTGPLRTMWNLHHEFHVELQAAGGGAHLSDELLLVSLPQSPPLPREIINDGSYIGVWLAQNGGPRLYAPDARVAIEVPRRVRDHLRQRRRIIFGNGQVTASLGSAPSTLVRYALSSPRQALGVVRRSVPNTLRGMGELAWLTAAEVAAALLAAWDRLPPQKDHLRWQRIELPSGDRPQAPSDPVPWSSQGNALERRVRTVVAVASQFGTGVPLPELLHLLPADGPSTVPEMRDWLSSRPHLARTEGGSARAPSADEIRSEDERAARATSYWRSAETLWDGTLAPAARWVRCVCVTGSAAYGTPNRGDDLDLFVVTRGGALWWFLATTYLALRLARFRTPQESPPTPCLNRVLEEQEAEAEFAHSAGFLFAREALTARPLRGATYYQGLLKKADWMAEEIPRLYRLRTRERSDEVTDELPVPVPVRLMNAAIFPWLATYLQLVGLRRDRRFRTHGISAS